MRKAQIERDTTETHISARLNVDGSGSFNVNTGCGFLDHMLELFARHGRFDLDIECKGDTHIDDHHTVEDVGIVLGRAFRQAVGEKRGIVRYGSTILPMDEALILVALDFSGRSTLVYDLTLKDKVGEFDTELVEEFFLAFVREARLTLHIKQLSGVNTHHIIEGAFKAFAGAMAQAVDVKYGEEIPSTKGVL